MAHRSTSPTSPTAPLAAAGLIAGYAVAAGTGSRPLGGVVLAGVGLACLRLWARRDGTRVAAGLGGVGLGAFAVSHVLARAIGAWPSVLVCAALVGATVWRVSDAPALGRDAPGRTSAAP